MLRASVETKEFAVHLMRNPGERMPVDSMKCSERPLDIRPVQAVFDVDIFGDIIRIIVVDELMPADRQKYEQRGERKQQSDETRRRQERKVI